MTDTSTSDSSSKGHFRRNGWRYIGGLAAAAVVGGAIWQGPTLLNKLSGDGSTSGPTTPTVAAPVAPSDDPTYGPRTLEVERFYDEDGDGEPDNLADVIRFKAIYTERPSGNTMVFSNGRIAYTAVDSDNFTSIDWDVNAGTDFSGDQFEQITAEYSGGTFPFTRSDLDFSTIQGQNALGLFENLDSDYHGVRVLMRETERADYEARMEHITSGLGRAGDDPSKTVYRVYDPSTSVAPVAPTGPAAGTGIGPGGAVGPTTPGGASIRPAGPPK